MASTRDEAPSTLAVLAAGAAAGAVVAYCAAASPAVRRLLWQALKLTVTTSLPAAIITELQAHRDAEDVEESASTRVVGSQG